MFRVGKQVDHLNAALKAKAQQDPFLRTALMTKAAGYGGWLLLDTLQWVITLQL